LTQADASSAFNVPQFGQRIAGPPFHFRHIRPMIGETDDELSAESRRDKPEPPGIIIQQATNEHRSSAVRAYT
jgi:hypothetical protein